jgi:hypothetical protein
VQYLDGIGAEIAAASVLGDAHAHDLTGQCVADEADASVLAALARDAKASVCGFADLQLEFVSECVHC